MNLRKISLFIIGILIISSLLLVSGCVREDEVCNYDAICTDDETDNCADCENVLGRAVLIDKQYADKEYSS